MTDENDAKTLRERWVHWRSQTSEAIKTLPAAFAMVREADPQGALVYSITTLLSAGLPAAQAYTAGRIVDTVVLGMTLNDPWAAVSICAPWVAVELGLVSIAFIISQVRILADHTLNARLSNYVATRVMTKSAELDIQYFEDPAFYDRLQNARRQAEFRALALVTGSFAIVQQFISLVSFLVLVIAFAPVLALILFGASIPAFIAQGRYSRLFFRLLTRRAPEFRQLRYLEELLTSDKTIKEVRLFGLAAPIMQRYTQTFEQYYHEDLALSKKRSLLSIVWGFVSTLSFYIAYGYVVWLALNGAVTIGGMTFYIALLRQSQTTFQSLFSGVNGLLENGMFMTNLVEFFAIQPIIRSPEHPVPVPDPMVQGITFHNVSFRYPDHTQWTLRDISFTIRAGETMALVGLNGAGKTTLVKLLTRLYDPTEGYISIDGIDIRQFALEDLNRHIGVIFQDFVRYQMTLADNIGFGNIAERDNAARIARAAVDGGADEIAAELANGYDTMLGRQFQQGRELSGGQWQKIALSRAFMRDGGILILDEPTSALDAQREHEVFVGFRELTKGRTAILISHRFSTVRIADRIAVLADGRLAELGTHAELIANNQGYAQLFEMQASGYR